jgi:hypothetical protein
MAAEFTDKSAWNLSIALLYEMQNLLQAASNNYLAGRIDMWFFNLKAVKMRIIADLDEDERLKLKKLEVDIAIALENWRLKKGSAAAVEQIENYNEQLFDLMEKYGLLLKKARDTTRIN